MPVFAHVLILCPLYTGHGPGWTDVGSVDPRHLALKGWELRYLGSMWGVCSSVLYWCWVAVVHSTTMLIVFCILYGRLLGCI